MGARRVRSGGQRLGHGGHSREPLAGSLFGMAVAHLEVTNRRPFAFDYERIDGKLHFSVDPAQAANARIVDLDKAPRDANGQVRFWADFLLLQPADAARSNRRLLYYVVNRGQYPGVPFNRFPPRLPTLPPSDDID